MKMIPQFVPQSSNPTEGEERLTSRVGHDGLNPVGPYPELFGLGSVNIGEPTRIVTSMPLVTLSIKPCGSCRGELAILPGGGISNHHRTYGFAA